MTCPVCQHAFIPTGRKKFCSDACRAAAYRRRRDARAATLVVPKTQPRRPITVYECDTCGDRASANSTVRRAIPGCAAWGSGALAPRAGTQWP